MKTLFEIFKDEQGKFRFRLKAENGEIVLQSEGYESKQGCMDTIKVLPKLTKEASIKDLTK